MNAQLQEPKRAGRAPGGRKDEAGPLEAVLRDGVLRALGRPEGLRRVQVSRVFAGRYRANVFVGADAVSSRVAHSYFLEADGDGKILASSPPLKRLY